MIKIKIPFRKDQSIVDMINWIQDQGLVFRRDWVWDSEKTDNTYSFLFDEKFSRVASTFVLKWL